METLTTTAPQRADAATATAPHPAPTPARPTPGTAPGNAPEAAFDLLYAQHAAVLVQQAYLLCGHYEVAHRAVRRAFHLAWQRWPEVAVDRDPAGWVRAAAHDGALSPWQRVWPARSGAQPPAGDAEDRVLLEALLSLPPSYRRCVLLHDGLGLGLPETAAEAEASTAATAGRLVHARATLAARLPTLAAAPAAERGRVLGERLRELSAAPYVSAEEAREVRQVADTSAHRVAWAALVLVALLSAVTALAIAAG